MSAKTTLTIDTFKGKKVVALTGAGISTLSGIPDFRSGNYEVWQRYTPEEVFSIDRFDRDPRYFYSFCRECFPDGTEVYQPNVIHTHLAKLEDKGMLEAVITQNIDGLHQKAGSQCVYELHGTWSRFFCLACKKRFVSEAFDILDRDDGVPLCDTCGGIIKPDIVFYGEMLPQTVLNNAIVAASKADFLLVLGSSLVVYPAASIPAYTLQCGGEVILFNDQATQYDDRAAYKFDDLQDFVRLCAGELH
ncbi:MAG: NAD-dependent deacetylase [Candidatus Omnitrophica bacterium]|nr:NAD-dependent deacetylase [Candidatus Omnitrophota bacterium]